MPDLAAFHFLRPAWLWLLLAAALVPCVAWLRTRRDRQSLSTIEPHLLAHLLAPAGGRQWFNPATLTAVGTALAAIGIAGPTWQRERPPFSQDLAPLVIAIDASWSMNAIDVPPTRLERAKDKVRAVLKTRAGARTALIAYAGSAHLVMPFTDGVPRDQIPAFTAQQQSPHDVLVLAVGTSEGGPIRVSDSEFRTGPGGEPTIARLDRDGLQALAREAGVFVASVTVDDRDIQRVALNVQRHLQAVDAADRQTRWRDAGYWFVFPVALIGALWFRQGWTVRWAAVFVAAVVWSWPIAAQTSPTARAQVPAEGVVATPGVRSGFHFVDLWLTRDQQGRYYFDRGDYATAAERFEDHLWKGLACHRAGNLPCAAAEFARLDTAEASFNLGNALARQGEYRAALTAYDRALAARPGFGDAVFNRALVAGAMKRPKPPRDEQADPPDLPPDKVQFDDKGKQGKAARVPRSMAQVQTDAWLKSVQSDPGEFLRLKFAAEARQAGAKEPPR